MEIIISSLKYNYNLYRIAKDNNTHIDDDKIDDEEYGNFIIQAAKCYENGCCTEEEFLSLFDSNDERFREKIEADKEGSENRGLAYTTLFGCLGLGGLLTFATQSALFEKCKYLSKLPVQAKVASLAFLTPVVGSLFAIGCCNLIDKISGGKLSKAKNTNKNRKQLAEEYVRMVTAESKSTEQ